MPRFQLKQYDSFRAVDLRDLPKAFAIVRRWRWRGAALDLNEDDLEQVTPLQTRLDGLGGVLSYREDVNHAAPLAFTCPTK